MERVPKSSTAESRPRRRSMLAVAFVTVVSILAAGCGDDDAGPLQSDEPPWGLDEIEMPDTDADVIALFEAMPAIDGRSPSVGMGEDECCPSATYYESEDGGFGVEIQAFPDDEPLGSLAPEALEAEGWVVEASVIGPNEDLAWTAIGPSPEDEIEIFGLLWANPNGSWRFVAISDTAEFRVELVSAFVAAAEG